MYTKFIQDVYIQNISHISTIFCIHFVYKIKRIMTAKLCIQNVYKIYNYSDKKWYAIFDKNYIQYKQCSESIHSPDI